MRPIRIFALSMIIGFACTVVAKDYCPKMSEAKKEEIPGISLNQHLPRRPPTRR